MKKFIGSIMYCLGLFTLIIDGIIWAFKTNIELGIMVVCLALMLVGRLIFEYDDYSED